MYGEITRNVELAELPICHVYGDFPGKMPGKGLVQWENFGLFSLRLYSGSRNRNGVVFPSSI